MRHHRKLHLWLDDAKQLRHYAQSAVSKHNALEDTLGKARAKSRYWERKGKEGNERATGAENERDEAKEENTGDLSLVAIALLNVGGRIEFHSWPIIPLCMGPVS